MYPMNTQSQPDRRAHPAARSSETSRKPAPNGAGARKSTAKPTAPKRPAASAAAAPKPARQAAAPGKLYEVRRSGVHGRGVYAIAPIAKGTTIVEYKGQMITWKQAERRHPHNPKDPDHTFFFQIDERHVIDAAVGGNAARWINHACHPNCESDIDEENFRVYIKALRRIKPGEELFYDYGLSIDERYTPKVKKQFACHCGARDCRGTMLSPKR